MNLNRWAAGSFQGSQRHTQHWLECSCDLLQRILGRVSGVQSAVASQSQRHVIRGVRLHRNRSGCVWSGTDRRCRFEKQNNGLQFLLAVPRSLCSSILGSARSQLLAASNLLNNPRSAVFSLLFPPSVTRFDGTRPILVVLRDVRGDLHPA